MPSVVANMCSSFGIEFEDSIPRRVCLILNCPVLLLRTLKTLLLTVKLPFTVVAPALIGPEVLNPPLVMVPLMC